MFPHDAVIHIFLAIIALLVSPSRSQAESVGQDYQTELIEQARQIRVADEREWHLLLHYGVDLFG
ncbi:MAG: hypothetical protein OEV17_10515, partial [Nitrospira sp.]|nr:hypothetical protein [Nitrospira sp.]